MAKTNVTQADTKVYAKLPKVLLLHPGTQYSFALARELAKRSMLLKFCTGFAYTKNSVWALLAAFFPPFKKRKIEGVSSKLLKIFPALEFKAVLEMKKTPFWEDILYRRNLGFQNKISDELLLKSDVVIGFDTASWVVAKRCKDLNIKFVLDVSIGHPVSKEKIYAELTKKYPAWADQLVPKEQFLIDKECLEIKYADLITVPSHFVKQTYLENGVEPEKIVVNNFGTDIGGFRAKSKKLTDEDEIVFLFFGSINVRKGLPFLLNVWNEIAPVNAKLLLAGYGDLPANVSLPKGAQMMGPILKENRQGLFDSAHVFVFPSFYEGLAQVQIEAAACGLPIIGTINSGAEEIVEEGKNGFIIEAGSELALKDRLVFFLKNKEAIEKMGVHSRKMAERFPWHAYGERWQKAINSVIP